MSLAPGSKIGPYEILAPIGAGGMGEVYRARDTKLQREVAVKVLPDAFATDADRIVRFTREALLLASLNHPGIAHIYGVEERALVMELVPGPTLADRIAGGPIPLDEALPIAAQIADAVEYAHDHNVIHRDLKPANVKVTPEGTVKVLDFGLAKALADEPDLSDPRNSPTLTMTATRAGVVLGTAAYMSPEQAKGKPVDRRADIWAFGVVLYEMLAGKPLHEGETVAETMASVILKDVKLDALPANTPPGIRHLLKRCLERDPRIRLQAMGEARIVLANPVPPEPLAPGAAAAPQKRLVAWVATVAALVLAVGVAVWAPWRTPPAREVMRFQVPPPEKMNFTFTAPPVISPDGRRLAFFANGDGGGLGQIWVRSLDTLEARMLPGTENAGGALFWSPDSRSLAFGAGPLPLKLKRVDVAGEPPQTLCEPSTGVPTGSWSREGVVVLSATGLLRVAAAGGDCTPVTVLNTSKGESFHRFPYFLPDGRHFVYQRVSSRPEVTGLYIGSLDTKPEQQSDKRLLATQSGAVYVPSPDGPAGFLLFLREGALIAQPFDAGRLELAGDAIPIAEQVSSGPLAIGGYFSASPTGVLAYRTGTSFGGGALRLTWFDRQGKQVSASAGGAPGTFNTPALSPDGTRVAFRADTQANLDLWLYDVVRTTSARFTFAAAVDTAPVWSPDSTRIAYASDRDLYLKVATGAGSEEPLFKSGQSKIPTDWSRDGRYLLFTSTDPKTGADLWVMPMTGERKPAVYLQTEFNETEGRFSPDGRFVAYQSNASGSNEIYVQPFPNPTGGKWMVSKGGGLMPRWRRDGKELYYLDSAGNNLMSVEVTPGPNFQAGVARTLFAFAAGPNPYDVSGDGQKFVRFAVALVASNAPPSPITVVLNWTAGLRK
ncbi:MAG: protein kinase [Acidobacteriia bacterium]|nr:protein kinase [Terriglobia bacterium]